MVPLHWTKLKNNLMYCNLPLDFTINLFLEQLFPDQRCSLRAVKRGYRGYLWYRARNFFGARNFENAERKKFRKKFERATLDWLKADKVTPRHHLPVIQLTHS